GGCRRALASDGSAAVVRPHRARHDEADRRLDVRRVQGSALRATATAAPHGGGRSAGQEVGPGLLQVLIRWCGPGVGDLVASVTAESIGRQCFWRLACRKNGGNRNGCREGACGS